MSMYVQQFRRDARTKKKPLQFYLYRDAAYVLFCTRITVLSLQTRVQQRFFFARPKYFLSFEFTVSCGAATIVVRLQFEREIFLKLKSGGAATIAVRLINGKIRYIEIEIQAFLSHFFPN